MIGVPEFGCYPGSVLVQEGGSLTHLPSGVGLGEEVAVAVLKVAAISVHSCILMDVSTTSACGVDDASGIGRLGEVAVGIPGGGGKLALYLLPHRCPVCIGKWW